MPDVVLSTGNTVADEGIFGGIIAYTITRLFAKFERSRLEKSSRNQTITCIDTKLRIVSIVKNALMASPFAPADP